MRRKILILGGGGFIGGYLNRFFTANGWDVFIAEAYENSGPSWFTVDITDRAAVNRMVRDLKPDALVNTAAISDIDLAEREKELARRINVEGAEYAAEACAASRARHIFFSSDAVFDGEKGGYREEDLPAPVNFYGRTKMEAEKVVLAACPSAAVIRISLILGYSPEGRRKNFLDVISGKLKSGEEILCPVEEVRTPLDVYTLAECILELAANRFQGIMHLGATSAASRFDLARRIAENSGYPADSIRRQVRDSEGGNRAPRHKNGVLDVAKARRILYTPLPSAEEAVRRALKEEKTGGGTEWKNPE
ncbi:MAG: SDR family oxidoreductase [Bacillota bacterium]